MENLACFVSLLLSFLDLPLCLITDDVGMKLTYLNYSVQVLFLISYLLSFFNAHNRSRSAWNVSEANRGQVRNNPNTLPHQQVNKTLHLGQSIQEWT